MFDLATPVNTVLYTKNNWRRLILLGWPLDALTDCLIKVNDYCMDH